MEEQKYPIMETHRAMTFQFFNPGRKRVLLRGPVLTQSGYGVHARQVARWLLSREDVDLSVQALPWGDTPWLINPDLCDGLVGKLMTKTVDPQGTKFDISVQLQLPNEWDSKLAGVNIGITAGVETDKCNPEWIHACNTMNHVVVPSNHTANCFKETGEVKSSLDVIPESYMDSLDQMLPTKIDDLEFSTPFNFLMVGQITGNNPENDRKNLFYAIKWFCETFSKDNSVGLVIKTNAGRNTDIDRAGVLDLFRKLLGEVRKGPFPKIHLIHGDLTDHEVTSLYRHNQIKAFLAPTRGEGYGLPILEAAVAGLPVIATGWSGHMDFLQHGKFIKLEYKLSEVHSSRIDNKIFMKGNRWANPIESDFKKKLEKFRSSPTVPKEWALDLSKSLVPLYSQESIQKKYNEILGKYFT